MENRIISLPLEKAREWYNSGNEALKEAVLQVYTKEELAISKFTDIKTFEDAYRALMLERRNVDCDFYMLDSIRSSPESHLLAIYKLDIIRKALNGDWNPSLVEGRVYYPYVGLYPAGKEARDAASSNNWKLGESFIADGKKYTLVGGDSGCSYCAGLAGFSFGYGGVLSDLGLLGCKSKEIAEHMSRYFSKEIFEATYTHHAGTYQWI